MTCYFFFMNSFEGNFGVEARAELSYLLLGQEGS